MTLRQRTLGWGLSLLSLLLVAITTFVQASRPTPIDLGTTLVALKYKDGVIVAADTRTSASSYVSHRSADKIVPVSDRCVVARSGSAADTQRLVHVTKQHIMDRYYTHGLRTTVPQTARWIETLIGSSSAELGVSLLIAGYDAARRSGRIYSLAASGALLEERTFAVAGSGSVFIAGFMDVQVHDCDSLEEAAAIRLCRQALHLAMARDASSGGFVRLFVCDSSGVRQEAFLPHEPLETPTRSVH